MGDSPPAHIGYVQQAVNAAEVHERAELGDVLDDPRATLAFFDLFEELFLGLGALFLDEFAAGHDDVAALLVYLEDLRLDTLSDVLADICGPADVHLGGRKECGHADVDEQSAFDLAHHDAGDDIALLAGGQDAFPPANAVSLALGKLHQPAVGLHRLQQNLNFLAGLDCARVGKLVNGNRSLALEPDFDDNPVTDHVHYSSGKDGPGLIRAFLADNA